MKRRKAISSTRQIVVKDLFSEPSSIQTNPNRKNVSEKESWYFFICQMDRVLNMRIYAICNSYVHDKSVGLQKGHKTSFIYFYFVIFFLYFRYGFKKNGLGANLDQIKYGVIRFMYLIRNRLPNYVYAAIFYIVNVEERAVTNIKKCSIFFIRNVLIFFIKRNLLCYTCIVRYVCV